MEAFPRMASMPKTYRTHAPPSHEGLYTWTHGTEVFQTPAAPPDVGPANVLHLPWVLHAS